MEGYETISDPEYWNYATFCPLLFKTMLPIVNEIDDFERVINGATKFFWNSHVIFLKIAFISWGALGILVIWDLIDGCAHWLKIDKKE